MPPRSNVMLRMKGTTVTCLRSACSICGHGWLVSGATLSAA